MINRIFGCICIILPLIISCSPGGTRPDDVFSYDAQQYERVSINYQTYGQGDTSLVFIHGLNLDHTYWEYHVKRLRSRYRILTLDLAGHGQSGRDRKSWTAESFAKDIAAIIIKEKMENVILIAHSIGGQIALHVINQMPDNVIELIGVENFKDVSFERTPEFENDFKNYLQNYKRNYAEISDAYARENIRSVNRDVINKIVKDYKTADPKISLAIFRNMTLKHNEDKYGLQRLKFKLKLIASDYAPFDEESLRKYAKNGYSIIWITDAGHFPMVEQPEQFFSALEKMLNNEVVNG